METTATTTPEGQGPRAEASGAREHPTLAGLAHSSPSSDSRGPAEATYDHARHSPDSRGGHLFASPNEAARSVHDGFLYWSRRVTDYSFQLSLAVLAALWATFRTLDAVMGNVWARVCVSLLVLNVALSLAGALVLSELHDRQLRYAEADQRRWVIEFASAPIQDDPWPFTSQIVTIGRFTRVLKAVVPILAGAALIAALVTG